MAWAGKVLRVNLSEGTCKDEPLRMDWAQQYLGQRGLATKYLVEETDPRVDPMSPDNKMIMTTGPLTGTCASTAGRYSVVTKGALTGAIACSNSGGFFGNELKNAGYDMIIFEGRAPQPVYLLLQNGDAKLIDGADVWGTSVWDTEEHIKAKHQDPLIRVAAIGVSGEKGVKFACVVNDMHRAAGRSGVGTVMGSKNLKAVAVRGTLGVRVDDPMAFMAATEAGKAVLRDNAVTGQGLPTYGTNILMNVINETGALPTHNHRDVQFDGAHAISGEAMHEPRGDGKTNLVTNQACFACTIACGRISTIERSLGYDDWSKQAEVAEESPGPLREAVEKFGRAASLAEEIDEMDAVRICEHAQAQTELVLRAARSLIVASKARANGNSEEGREQWEQYKEYRNEARESEIRSSRELRQVLELE